jgi:hypothetical protein
VPGIYVFIRTRLAVVKDENKKDLNGSQSHRDLLKSSPNRITEGNPPLMLPSYISLFRSRSVLMTILARFRKTNFSFIL